jgi:CubicO group peptidase (beta-lactamase class C family)
VLCQLFSASYSAASGSAADSFRTASLDGAASGHSVTVDRTSSGSSVIIDQTDSAVSVTIDGREPSPAGANDGDPRPQAIIYLNNTNLPAGGERKDSLPGGLQSLDAFPIGVADSDLRRIPTIDQLLQRAIAQNLIEGGVALVGNHSGILSSTARGHLSSAAGSPLITERTIFDLASLTKVIATAPAVMKLLDEGRIALADPLSRWIPEFANPGHEEITVLSLLTHTSGLDDFGISSDQPMQSAIHKAAAQRYRVRPGSHFHYADINFILLGELVHRVSGEPLNAFCQEQIYRPLGSRETMFLPPSSLACAIAPTSGGGCGVVQDPNARRLGGVAGHAGLFSSAYDLSRFARMILGGGMIDDRRILSQQIVTKMISPYVSNNGAVWRGLGWDMNSPFSAPKGSYFSQASFGHTGYSGSSIWIDPQQDLFVILLTNRVNYRDVRNFNQLRRDVSTVASAGFRAGGDSPGLAPLELAKINEELLREVTRVVQSAPRRVKLASLGGHKWQHPQRTDRRACRTPKMMARGTGGRRGTRSADLHRVTRTAKAQGVKAAGSGKKKRAQGRRA